MSFCFLMARRALATSVVACLVMITSAQAAIVTHVFSGQVTNVGGAPGVSLGAAVTATLIYNTDQAPVLMSATQANYAAYSLITEVGSFMATETPGSVLTVLNNGGGLGVDSLLTNGATNGGAGFSLADSTASVFSSTDLPTSLLLSDFDELILSVPFASGPLLASITSVQTTVVPSEVPLPAAAWMFLVGAGALATSRRRNREKVKVK